MIARLRILFTTHLPTLRMLGHRLAPVFGLILLVLCMDGRWTTAGIAHASPPTHASPPAHAHASPPAHASSPRASPSRAAASSSRESPRPRSAPPARKPTTGKLNINTATEDQLVLLPTIGPAKAERIVAFRHKHGSFKRIADLRRVSGIGYKTFKRLQPFLAVTGETTLGAPPRPPLAAAPPSASAAPSASSPTSPR